MATITQTPGFGVRSQSRRKSSAGPLINLRTLKQQFILYAGLALLFAGVLTWTSASAFNRASSDLATIDSGSIPSVNYAQTIAQDIEEIDAQAADYLATAGLTSTITCFIPTDLSGHTTTMSLTNHTCDEHQIDAETVQVNQSLFLAANNVTYTGEQTAVERISLGLQSYLADIHQMRVDFGLAKSKTDPADPELQQAYQAYLQGSRTLYSSVGLDTLSSGQIHLDQEKVSPGSPLPACQTINGQTISAQQWTQGSLMNALDCLSWINYSHLQSAYQDSGDFLSGATTWIAILAVLLTILLLIATLNMMARSHRFINPGLLPALLISLIFGSLTVGLLGSLQGTSTVHSQDGAFVQLVSDDYQSVYDANVLTRVSTDANADESRWLIALEFKDQVNVAHWQQAWDQNVQQVESLIHQAHQNQTWNTEIQPLNDMDATWNQYDTLDGQIRAAAQNKSDPTPLLSAEKLSTGASNQNFSKFTAAVAQLGQANQDQYNQTFDSINGSLMAYFVLSLILFPLCGLLALWGISLRLKDF